MSMVDPGCNFANSDHFLHRHKDELHRQKANTLVEEVHGTEEYQVPGTKTQGV